MKITTAILAVLAAGSFTFATAEGSNEGKERKGGRPHHGKGKEGKERAEKMFKELNLTEEQKTKVQDIMKAHHEEMKAQFDEMRKKREANKESGEKPSQDEIQQKRETMRANMKAKRDAVHSQIRAVLTPEQQTKFDEISAKRKEKMEAKRKEMQERGKKGGQKKGGRKCKDDSDK